MFLKNINNGRVRFLNSYKRNSAREHRSRTIASMRLGDQYQTSNNKDAYCYLPARVERSQQRPAPYVAGLRGTYPRKVRWRVVGF